MPLYLGKRKILLSSGLKPAPLISNIVVTPISSTSFVVTWHTSFAATSQVFYGTTSGYGSSTTKDNTLVTSHSVTVSGLTANTLYHFKVESGALGHSTADSGDQTVTTLNVAPVISGISATDHGTYIIVTWTTDVASTSQINYGLTSGYGSSSTLDPTLVTSHSVTLPQYSLSYNTLYHYQCVSGATGRDTGMSTDQTTTTLAFPAGDDGAIHVTNGQTVNWSAGSVHDHTTILIDAGGLIQVSPASNPLPVCIGYTTSMAVNGFLTYAFNTPFGGTYAITAPDGTNVTYDLILANGGGGGTAPNGYPPPIGGEGGDGGQSGQFGSAGQDGWSFDFSSPTGGYGGVPTSYGGPVDGGSGNDGSSNDDGLATGGGGGGGAGGGCGGCLYIKGNGNITGAAGIDCSGSPGGNAGGGGNAADFFSAQGGGGGGGGAGGCGGKIYQRRHGGSSFFGSAFINGGAAGNGQTGGSATALNPTNGADGNPGDNGPDGSLDNATY